MTSAIKPAFLTVRVLAQIVMELKKYIMPIINQNSELSEAERKKLKALLREAESRGLPIAEELRKKFVKTSRKWITDDNGYFTSNDGRFFKPYEAQRKFLQSKARFSLFIGGRGSGKSCCGAQKALQKIMNGHSGAVLNPKFENFKDSTWPEFRNWIPWKYVVKEHRYRSSISWEPQRPFRIVFENGAAVICKGLHDPSSARGPNINWLWFDEAQEDPDGMAWKVAIASVRVGENPQAWATATGRGTYHWMYSFFVEQRFPDEVLKELEKYKNNQDEEVPLIEWFEGSIFDNKENLDPMFFASMLASYPVGYLRDQELYGKFADPGGNLGDPRWFEGHVLEYPPEEVDRRIRYWDLAASEKKIAGKKAVDPDETVGTLLSYRKDEDKRKFFIEHQISGYWAWEEIKEKILMTAKSDGPFVAIYIEEEPGSGGINQVAQIRSEIQKELPGWSVYGHNPRKEGGDKVQRANIWFAEASLGQFWMVRGRWNDEFLKQLSSFPNAKHDDKIDSVSGARICIAPIHKWKKIEFIHVMQEDRGIEKTEDDGKIIVL